MKKLIFNVAMVFAALGLCAQYSYADDVENPCDLTQVQFEKAYMNRMNNKLFDEFDIVGNTSSDSITGDGAHNQKEWEAMLAHLTEQYPWFGKCDHFTWAAIVKDGYVSETGLISKASAKKLRNLQANKDATYKIFRAWYGCDDGAKSPQRVEARK